MKSRERISSLRAFVEEFAKERSLVGRLRNRRRNSWGGKRSERVCDSGGAEERGNCGTNGDGNEVPRSDGRASRRRLHKFRPHHRQAEAEITTNEACLNVLDRCDNWSCTFWGRFSSLSSKSGRHALVFPSSLFPQPTPVRPKLPTFVTLSVTLSPALTFSGVQ